jgi:hypothetical protein
MVREGAGAAVIRFGLPEIATPLGIFVSAGRVGPAEIVEDEDEDVEDKTGRPEALLGLVDLAPKLVPLTADRSFKLLGPADKAGPVGMAGPLLN